jgi:arginase family enzyme
MSPVLQAPFAGAHSFARAATGTLVTVRAGEIGVIGVPYEGAEGVRAGMREGPRAIREASVGFVYPLQTSGSLVDISSGRVLTWPAQLRLRDLGDLPIASGDPDRTFASIRQFAAAIARKGGIPAALGGDRYITYPLVQGCADAARERGGAVGLIQLSGDLAFGDQHPTGSRHWYGATLRRIVDGEAVRPARIAVIGVRGLQAYDQWEEARRLGISVIPLKMLRREGIVATAKRALEIAGGDDQTVYVSLDIGVVDAAEAPGQGMATIGGLTALEFLEFVRALGQPAIRALDVVGVAPGLDLGGRVAWLAAQAVIELIAPRVFQ